VGGDGARQNKPTKKALQKIKGHNKKNLSTHVKNVQNVLNYIRIRYGEVGDTKIADGI
jgi:hypothetical protein